MTKNLCRKNGISDATFYNWKAKYAGMTVSEARRLRQSQQENTLLKKLLAEAERDMAALKDLLGENGRPASEARSGRGAEESTAWE